MGLTLVTPPTAEPVTLEEAKAQLNYLADDKDAYIESLIVAATRHVEKVLGLSLMQRTYRLTLDSFSGYIELLRGPVQSVLSVKYVDAAGETQTVATSNYSTDLASSRQWIVRNSDYSWPTTLDGVNAVMIEYIAGYGELPTELADLKHAILLLVSHWFNTREAVTDKPAQEVPLAFDALVQPHRQVMV